MRSTDIRKLLVDSRVACELLDMSERKLWSLRKSGSIPFLKVGNSIKFSICALEEWIQAQQRKVGGENGNEVANG